jgi:CRISPR-associated protein Cas2
MPIHQIQQYLVIYDISHPKRLVRVHRTLKKQGFPVQYSVFTVMATAGQIQHLMALLNNIIDKLEDDVRCYSLPSALDCQTLGVQIFPEDVLLFSQGKQRLML